MFGQNSFGFGPGSSPANSPPPVPAPAVDMSREASMSDDTSPSSNVQMPQMVFYTSGVGDPVVQVLDTASDTISISLLEVHYFLQKQALNYFVVN